MLPPPGLILEALAYGVLIPAVVAGLGLFLALRRSNETPAIGDALAVAAGLLAGFVALAASGQLGWEFLTPTDSWHWLLPLALLALAAGAAGSHPAMPRVGRRALRLGVAALTGWLLVRAESAMQPLHPVWAAGIVIAVLLIWDVLDAVSRRWRGGALPGLLAVVALAAGVLLELAGILKFAQMAGVLAAVLAGCACLGWKYPQALLARGAIPAVAVLLPGLLAAGYWNSFSDVPVASYLLMLATPLTLAATEFLPFQKLGAAARWAAWGAAVVLPIGLAVTLAAFA
jgi:hypothetical protein